MNTTEATSISDELLRRFCGIRENEIRLYLCEPWRRGEFIYATNGHILIEVPDDGRATVAEWTSVMPMAEKLFDKYPAGEFVPMPALGAIKAEHKCERCDGKGWHHAIACDECGGSGEFEHGSHEYECKECDGEGSVGSKTERTTCAHCQGFGEDGSWRGEEAIVGDGGYQARYLRLFARLPHAEIAPNGRDAGAHIRFTGGRGMVMPMRARSA